MNIYSREFLVPNIFYDQGLLLFFFIPFYFEGKLQTDILKKYLIKKKTLGN